MENSLFEMEKCQPNKAPLWEQFSNFDSRIMGNLFKKRLFGDQIVSQRHFIMYYCIYKKYT